LKPFTGQGIWNATIGCNELENPIGIETSPCDSSITMISGGCNELENPIGIETGLSFWEMICVDGVATNLKTR